MFWISYVILLIHVHPHLMSPCAVHENGDFPGQILFISMPENYSKGKIIKHNISIVGPPLNVTLTLEQDGNISEYFAINSSTFDVYLLQEIDIDNKTLFSSSSISLTLICEENTPNSQAVSYRVSIKVTDVNEFTPVFYQQSYIFNVSELSFINSVVGKVSAYDRDLRSSLDYALIIDKSSDQDAFEFFAVSESTGEVTLKRQLDYETRDKFKFLVKVSDALGLHSNASVEIQVEDADDRPVHFVPCNFDGFRCRSITYTTHIREDTNVPYDIEKYTVDFKASAEKFGIRAVDSDSNIEDPPNIMYNLTDFSEEFSINASTGVITLMSELNFENATSYNFYIKAFQENDPYKSAFSEVQVIVDNVNEYKPQLMSNDSKGYILENQPIGTFVSSASSNKVFSAEFKDIDQDMLTASISNSEAAEVFELVSFSREVPGKIQILLKSLKVIDREVLDPPQINLTLIVSELSTVEKWEASLNIFIEIGDVNDVVPNVFINGSISNHMELSIPEKYVKAYRTFVTLSKLIPNADHSIKYKKAEASSENWDMFWLDSTNGELQNVIELRRNVFRLSLIIYNENDEINLSSFFTVVIFVNQASNNQSLHPEFLNKLKVFLLPPNFQQYSIIDCLLVEKYNSIKVNSSDFMLDSRLCLRPISVLSDMNVVINVEVIASNTMYSTSHFVKLIRSTSAECLQITLNTTCQNFTSREQQFIKAIEDELHTTALVKSRTEHSNENACNLCLVIVQDNLMLPISDTLMLFRNYSEEMNNRLQEDLSLNMIGVEIFKESSDWWDLLPFEANVQIIFVLISVIVLIAASLATLQVYYTVLQKLKFEYAVNRSTTSETPNQTQPTQLPRFSERITFYSTLRYLFQEEPKPSILNGSPFTSNQTNDPDSNCSQSADNCQNPAEDHEHF